MIDADLHLWRAVLVQGLQDAAEGREADWLDTSDFEAVCHLAQVEPAAVLVAFRLGRLTTRRRKSAVSCAYDGRGVAA